MIRTFETEIGGKLMSFETGRLAAQAGGAVTLRYGDVVLLATATADKNPRTGVDFLPLTVDVAEKAYAVGKMPGGFFKREGRPGAEAILAARLCDRPLRPLFPKTYHNETQLIVTVLAADEVNPHAPLGIVGASAALAISDIPFDDPVGACNIGYIDGELVVNPTYEELEVSALELTVAGTADAIMMVEAGANFVSEEVILEALKLAQEVNGEIVSHIREIQAEVGKAKWGVPESSQEELDAKSATRAHVGDAIKDALKLGAGKEAREEAVGKIMSEAKEELTSGDDAFDSLHVQTELYSLEKEAVREGILQEDRRPDGRTLEELRDLESMIGYLPRVHGSSIFRRGETQVLGVLTLASAADAQKLDNLSPITTKRFMHHYNFPPYSTGEAGRFGFTGRREVGHGMLAERALRPVIPPEEDFPYSLRLVSEVMASNGSTSMASVCAGTLAMMDGGVPISAPVAGIAMGLITGENGVAKVLTDIQGAEDHAGDMDFKVAGTRDGVTALQMDIKVKGINYEIMSEALEQARIARLEILDHMDQTIPAPRQELRDGAPRMTTIMVPKDKIGMVIGPGGANVRGIQEEFGVSVNIEDDGSVTIGGTEKEKVDGAINSIRTMTKDIEVGETYKGKVVKIMDFGCFVNLIPGKDGMVHISELSETRVPDVQSVASEGDELEVMVVNVDQNGRVDLSARAIIDKANYDGDHDRALEEAVARRKPGNRGGRNDRGGNRGRRFEDGGNRGRRFEDGGNRGRRFDDGGNRGRRYDDGDNRGRRFEDGDNNRGRRYDRNDDDGYDRGPRRNNRRQDFDDDGGSSQRRPRRRIISRGRGGR